MLNHFVCGKLPCTHMYTSHAFISSYFACIAELRFNFHLCAFAVQAEAPVALVSRDAGCMRQFTTPSSADFG